MSWYRMGVALKLYPNAVRLVSSDLIIVSRRRRQPRTRLDQRLTRLFCTQRIVLVSYRLYLVLLLLKTRFTNSRFACCICFHLIQHTGRHCIFGSISCRGSLKVLIRPVSVFTSSISRGDLILILLPIRVGRRNDVNTSGGLSPAPNSSHGQVKWTYDIQGLMPVWIRSNRCCPSDMNCWMHRVASDRLESTCSGGVR